jgi:hypothetical protein
MLDFASDINGYLQRPAAMCGNAPFLGRRSIAGRLNGLILVA